MAQRTKICSPPLLPLGSSQPVRKSSNERGYGVAWQKARLGHLAESPLCVLCQKGGRLVAASVVDHIVPHKGDMQKFWDRSNWQSLCKSCHDVKTSGEGAFGRKAT